MSTLEIRNLIKTFNEGSIVAVDDVTIDAHDGEFIVVVGPSGCGKSTTLSCVAGLAKPTDGEIFVGGQEITYLSPQDRNIAMVFQNYALYPHKDVKENLAFGLNMSTDLSSSEIDDRIQDVAELLQIEELLDQHPRELSGGQQQRVALGRAIVREPDAFLMDEPLSNLDAKLRSEMRTEIQRLQNNLEITTLYVTHDQTEAMTMGDRIAVMNDGKLQQLATPLEVYHQPANQFVAGFIGEPSMNFFETTKTDHEGDKITLKHEYFSYEMTDVSTTVVQNDAAVTLGIRPSSMKLAETSADSDISVRVEVVEPMGDHNFVYFSFDQKTYTVKLPGHQMPPEGSTVGLTIPSESVYLFDRKSGETLQHPDEMPEDRTDLTMA